MMQWAWKVAVKKEIDFNSKTQNQEERKNAKRERSKDFYLPVYSLVINAVTNEKEPSESALREKAGGEREP